MLVRGGARFFLHQKPLQPKPLHRHVSTLTEALPQQGRRESLLCTGLYYISFRDISCLAPALSRTRFSA